MTHRIKQLHPFIAAFMRNPEAPRSGSPPRNILIPSSFDQPRAAEIHNQKQPPPILNQADPRSGRPPQKQPPSICNPAAPRSGSAPHNSSIFSSSIEQPRAAGAPPKQPPSICNPAAPRSGSAPHKQHLLFLYRAAPRSGRSPQSSLLQVSIKQLRAAGYPSEAAFFHLKSNSPAQRELPQKQLPPTLNPAVSRSGSTPHKQHLPVLYRAAPRSGSSPRSSLLPP